MNTTATVLLAVTGVCALVDWFAVVKGPKALEYVFKPATLIALIGVALTLDAAHGSVRTWFVVALVFSLIGDVFLMLPQNLFVAGLASFLLGHIAYIVGLQVEGVDMTALAVGIVIVLIAMAVLGRRIVGAVRSGDEPALGIPVTAYMLVISTMVASAIGTQNPYAIGGASLFYASDALIAWNRFIHEYPWGRFAIISTYHLAQVGLVLALLP